jgi:fucose 4-O-acetylase-like acetyltransferase
MHHYYQRRIRVGADVEYEGLFEFYKRLERREQAECLWKIAMAVSVPVMLWMTMWCAAEYVDGTPARTTLASLVSSLQ